MKRACAQEVRGTRAPIHPQLIPRWKGGVTYIPQQPNWPGLSASVSFCQLLSLLHLFLEHLAILSACQVVVTPKSPSWLWQVLQIFWTSSVLTTRPPYHPTVLLSSTWLQQSHWDLVNYKNEQFPWLFLPTHSKSSFLLSYGLSMLACRDFCVNQSPFWELNRTGEYNLRQIRSIQLWFPQHWNYHLLIIFSKHLLYRLIPMSWFYPCEVYQ